MSRRTFIKQWNPAVPIGGRGRGRKGKKGGDPDQAYLGGIRTLHDPSVGARRKDAGRDEDGSTRFYSASGLTAAGIPAPEDRFRAQTLPSSGRGKVQQRVGMFRNAIQSNVIFGGTSEKVLRTSRKKIERILAPESDVPESVSEWRRSPAKNNQRRRDVYEYESDEEDEEMEEAPRYAMRRRVSNPRRTSDPRRDPGYDPYEFRDDDSADERFAFQQPPRPRRTNSRITAGPSSSRAPPAFARERLRGNDERTHPRRLFGETSEEEEMEQYDRRPMTRRGGAEERQEDRMEKRATKRPREMSPARPLVPVARQRISERHSRRDPPPLPAALATPAAAPQSSVNWLREQAGTDDAPQPSEPQYPKGYDANYTPAIAMGIARRILSGLPRIRLKDDDGGESYLTASRSIIAGALERFTAEDPEGGGEGDPPSDGVAAAAAAARGENNPGANVLRELMNRTQLINISEESEDDDDEGDGSEADARGRFENIFSRHAREDSPVLERLFNQTMREASNPFAGEVDEEQEVDTAKMLGLADENEQQPGSGDADPFEVMPRTSAGEESGSGGASSGSNGSSVLSTAHFVRRSMADSHRSLALLAASAPPPPQQQQQLRFAAGGARDGGASSSRSSDNYSSDQSNGSRMGRGGGGGNERSFPFHMGGIPAHSTHLVPAAPSNYEFRTHNNNDGSFNFEF